MSTTIRPELSEKNEYYVEKHRYYELMHFCRQFGSWRKKLEEIYGTIITKPVAVIEMSRIANPDLYSKTENAAIESSGYLYKIEIISKCSMLADPELSDYIFRAVTEGVSYNSLRCKGMPAGKNKFYAAYRKFFWLLDKERD